MSKMIPKHILKYPTPLHIFYPLRLKQDAVTVYSGLRKFLPSASLYYSTKTNALLPVLKTVLEIGYGLEVITPGDLRAAHLAGAKGAQILLNGAAWTKEFMGFALLEQHVSRVHLDSLDQLTLLEQILAENKNAILQTNFGLRVHEGNSHFGIPANEANLLPIVKQAKRAGITIDSIHIHKNSSGGKQSAEKTAATFKESAALLLKAKKIIESTGHKISTLDLGGGIESPYVYRLQEEDLSHYHSAQGVPENAAQVRPSLQEQCESISKTLADFLALENASSCKILFEPGRSVVSRALGSLVQVVATKDLYPDAHLLITNGNTSILGPLHREIHPIIVENANEPQQRTFLYGNLPHSSDWLAQGVLLPKQEREGRILFEHTGAYFLSLESNFGYVRPGVYDSESDTILRTPEKISDLSIRDKI